MLEHPSGFPRARTLLPETPDPPSFSGVSACAGKPDVFSPRVESNAELLAAITDLDEVEAVTVRRTPARAGTVGVWPEWIDPRVRACFARIGVEQPYLHQQIGLEALHRGRDLVLATATASGKSLCYQAPVLQAVLTDPASRALFLFPTKALARDQVEALRSLVDERTPLAGCVGAGTYDGDTPPDQRR